MISKFIVSRVPLLIMMVWLLYSTTSTCSWKMANKDTLKLVQVIFRHGDRAPTKVYPNDPYINDFDKLWPEGIAQLTNRGKMQQWELGQFLRQRYDGYLAKKYSQKELYVTSSDMDRTIMSLESNLAGLFPPVDHSKWNPEIDWQPIPLRTIPKNEDKYLHNNVKCPKYSALRSEFYTLSEVVRKINKEHQDFIRYCAKHSGLEITTMKELYPLLDVLYAQASHNYTLPDWAQGKTLAKLLELNAIVNTWPTYTNEMKRLWGGPFLHLLLKNMQAISGHLADVGASHDNVLVHSVYHGMNRKMLMYSAHDSTLARIMNTMGVFEPHCPPYASALLIELHQDQDSLDYFIQIHYRNDTTREPFLLTPLQCEHPCKFETYLQLTQHLIPVNWKQECQLNADDASADPEFFTTNGHNNKLQDDDDQEEFKKPSRNFLKSSSSDPNSDWKPTTEPCYSSSSQLLFLGFGLVVSSALLVFVIVKVLQYRSGKGDDFDHVRSSGKELFVEIFSKKKPTHYRSTYERL